MLAYTISIVIVFFMLAFVVKIVEDVTGEIVYKNRGDLYSIYAMISVFWPIVLGVGIVICICTILIDIAEKIAAKVAVHVKRILDKRKNLS